MKQHRKQMKKHRLKKNKRKKMKKRKMMILLQNNQVFKKQNKLKLMRKERLFLLNLQLKNSKAKSHLMKLVKVLKNPQLKLQKNLNQNLQLKLHQNLIKKLQRKLPQNLLQKLSKKQRQNLQMKLLLHKKLLNNHQKPLQVRNLKLFPSQHHHQNHQR